MEQNQDLMGEFKSPGGFVFGIQGWIWGEPRPKAITFFLDNTAKVSDQHGRPIRGVVMETPTGRKEVRFAQGPPQADDPPGARAGFATHAQVIEALAHERIEWQKLACAGWPQLPYNELVKLPESMLPPITIIDGYDSYMTELRKIADPATRKDALRFRREAVATRVQELQLAEEE